MTYLLALAESIARKAHEGQFRRDGITPYITHPERVVARLKQQGASEEALIVGWLHDVFEDCGIVEYNLISSSMPFQVVRHIEFLTREEHQPYEEFIDEITGKPTAREVKIADILDNMSDTPTEEQIIKYCKALLTLHGQ